MVTVLEKHSHLPIPYCSRLSPVAWEFASMVTHHVALRGIWSAL